jgi:arylsulfatase A-like enzyme
VFERRRALSASLAPTPFTHGLGYGLSLLGVMWLCRVGMIVLAARERFLAGLRPAHLGWIGPALGQDLVVAAGTALFTGAVLRVMPRRARLLGTGIGYLWLIFASLIGVASVPLYGAIQTTMQLTQLLLAGGVRDLIESAVGVVPGSVLVGGVSSIALACFVVPWLALVGKWLLRALRSFRVRAAIAALASAALVAEWFAPVGGASGLEMDPAYEFVASAARYYLRQRDDAALIDMRNAPHFTSALIRGNPRATEPLERLVDTSKLPLKRANVVLIVLESAAISQYGLWGGNPETTPRLRELAPHSLIFDDYYTASPVSMKSLFTLTCSSYPQPHPNAETYTNPGIDCLSISEVLKGEGYRTGLFHGGRFSYTHKDAYFSHRRYDVMRDAETLLHRTHYAKVPWGTDDRAVIDDAIDWLNQSNQRAPFFLNIIFLAPHHPYDLNYDIPKPFGNKTDAQRYQNATLFIDGQIGRLWDWAAQKGKTDDTIFVIVGDHGEAFGEHPGHFTHGTRIYEESVRTPMMIVNPLLFKGARTERVGNHVDLEPTILDLVGVKDPPRHQGQSLLRGYKPHMIYFYADWYRHYLGLRDGQWKYIYELDHDKSELYDLDHDRAEHNNLAKEHPDQVAAYAERTLQWERFYRELIPNYEHYVTAKGACPGRAACFLDELNPVLEVGTFVRNRNAVGWPLEVGKQSFARGIGVSPPSILRYSVRNEGFRRLVGAVGHHAQGGRNPNSSLKVDVEIYLDDKLIWSSGKLTADDPPMEFDLDIRGGSVLELIGHDVDGENWHDWIDWVNVRLQR